MTDDFTFYEGDGAALLAMLDEVTQLYLAVHSEGPQGFSPLYSRESFLDRTNSQVTREGFSAVWVRLSETDELIGFSFGLPFAAGRWWASNIGEPPPAEMVEAPKFAVIELHVATAYRGRGLGRELIDMLLSGRPETYAMLTTVPQSFARGMYARWGWQQVGTSQATPDAPIMDQLILRLADRY